MGKVMPLGKSLAGRPTRARINARAPWLAAYFSTLFAKSVIFSALNLGWAVSLLPASAKVEKVKDIINKITICVLFR